MKKKQNHRLSKALVVEAGFPYCHDDNDIYRDGNEKEDYPMRFTFETPGGDGEARKAGRGAAWHVRSPASGDFRCYGSKARVKRKIKEREERQAGTYATGSSNWRQNKWRPK